MVIVLLTVITGSQSLPYPEAPENNSYIMIVLAPIILLANIIIGIKQQSNKEVSEANKQKIKSNKINYIILFICLLIFLLILFTNIYILPHIR